MLRRSKNTSTARYSELIQRGVDPPDELDSVRVGYLNDFWSANVGRCNYDREGRPRGRHKEGTVDE